MKKKILTSVIVAAGAAFSLSAHADPAPHGITDGRCMPSHPNTTSGTTNPFDCVEWKDSSGDWHHATVSEWFGPDGLEGVSDPFAFSGPSELVCSGITLDCTLTLEGYARINTEQGNDFGIKVVDGSVSGGLLCSSVSMDHSTPWFVDENTSTGPWNNSSYISDAQSLDDNETGYAAGSIGNIAFTAAGGLINISDGVMYDVEFHNGGSGNPSYFAFDGDILVPDGSGGLTPSGCEIIGNLENDDINAW